MNSRVAHINILDYDIYTYIYPYLHIYILYMYIWNFQRSHVFFAVNFADDQLSPGWISPDSAHLSPTKDFSARGHWGIFGWEVMGDFHVNIGE